MKKRGHLKLSGLIQAGTVVPKAIETEAEATNHEPKKSTAILGLSATALDNQVDRDLRHIKVAQIDPNPLAPREIYTAEMLRKRAEELQTQGQHDAIHVIPSNTSPDRFIIADGWTRVRACIEHNVQETLVAEIHHDLDIKQAAWFGYEQNEGRTQQCDFDKAMFYERMLSAGESQAELAARANLSRTMLTYYRSYSRLPSTVTEIIRKYPEKFGSLVAYNLQRLSDSLGDSGIQQVIDLTTTFAEGDFSVKWLTTQVGTHLKQTKEPAPQSSSTSKLRQVRYANGGYKLKGNTVEMSIKIPDDKKDAFITALEHLLETVGIDPSNMDA